jgi:hypothetical protein
MDYSRMALNYPKRVGKELNERAPSLSISWGHGWAKLLILAIFPSNQSLNCLPAVVSPTKHK